MGSICCPICGSTLGNDDTNCGTCNTPLDEIVYTLTKSLRERRDPFHISIFDAGDRKPISQIACPECGARTVNFSSECHACGFSVKDAIREGRGPILNSDARYIERRAIALDPSASQAILEILACDALPFVQRGVAANPNAPKSFLIAQSRSDDAAMRCAIAGNPSTPLDILETLAHDSQEIVKRQVALNNAASDTCRRKALSDMSLHSLEQLARSQSAHWLLDTLADSREHQVRAAVAANPMCQYPTLAKLCCDSEECVRACVARNFEAPAKLLASMQHDESPIVRYELARNPSTVIDLREALFKQDDVILVAKKKMTGVANTQRENPDKIREHFFSQTYAFRELAASPCTQEATIRDIAELKDGPLQRFLLRNPKTPIDIIRRIVESTEADGALPYGGQLESAILDAAEREDVDEEIIYLFATSSFARVRKAAADDPRISIEHLEMLSRSESPSIRAKAARNAKATASILERLAFDTNDEVKLSVLWNPRTPRDLAVSIVCRSYARTAELLKARNPEIGAEELNRLCTVPTGGSCETDANHAVRVEVAQNPSASARLLEILARDPYREVRDAVLRNPNAPDRVARIAEANEAPTPMRGKERVNRALQTAEDFDDLVWRYGYGTLDRQHDYALMSDSDYDFLYELSEKHKEFAFGEKSAEEWGTPEFIFERIAAGSNVRARKKLAENRCIPTHLQRQLAYDESVDVRRNLVDNDFATPDVLDILSYDIDNHIRAIARSRLRRLFT